MGDDDPPHLEEPKLQPAYVPLAPLPNPLRLPRRLARPDSIEQRPYPVLFNRVYTTPLEPQYSAVKTDECIDPVLLASDSAIAALKDGPPRKRIFGLRRVQKTGYRKQKVFELRKGLHFYIDEELRKQDGLRRIQQLLKNHPANHEEVQQRSTPIEEFMFSGEDRQGFGLINDDGAADMLGPLTNDQASRKTGEKTGGAEGREAASRVLQLIQKSQQTESRYRIVCRLLGTDSRTVQTHEGVLPNRGAAPSAIQAKQANPILSQQQARHTTSGDGKVGRIRENWIGSHTREMMGDLQKSQHFESSRS